MLRKFSGISVRLLWVIQGVQRKMNHTWDLDKRVQGFVLNEHRAAGCSVYRMQVPTCLALCSIGERCIV